uniref:Uncharacterized protein n=1 Tax=Glossina morsitans morsitans TaxID=37546 RepID=A0A1B0G5T3_GLOMM
MELDMGSATSSLIIEHLTSNFGRTRTAVQKEKEEISTAETHGSEVPQENLALEMSQQNEILGVTSASALSLLALNAETKAASAPTGEANENNDNSAQIAAIIGLNLDEHDDSVRQQILFSTADEPRELDE